MALVDQLSYAGNEAARRYLDGKVEMSAPIGEEMQHILYDPQTSGGLLFALPPDAIARVEARFEGSGLSLWRVGDVIEGRGISVVP